MEIGKGATLPNSSHKASNLFESLISTNIIDKCPFDLEPYRENIADLEPEEIDILKIEEMFPQMRLEKGQLTKVSLEKKNKKLEAEEEFSI